MRRAVLADLKQLSDADKKNHSQKILNSLAKHLENCGGIWAAFMPLGSEPQITWSLVSKEIQWCFPILQENQLSFMKMPRAFEKNSLGFSEPTGGEIIQLSDIQGFVIPGVAFDREGHRLGRGQGYYDRTLKNYKGSIFGVCFHTALKDQVPTEDHDLKCHLILTENQSVAIEGVNTWN